MLHSFYREFLALKQPAQTLATLPEPGANSPDMRQLMQERLAATQGGRGCDEQLTDAFARAADCSSCGLGGVGGVGSSSVGEFAKWRATALRRVAVQEAVIGCWVHAMSAPFDWAWIRRSKACLCPFVVRWGNSGAFTWRPAAVESTCLLLAQTCSIGVDLHLRIVGGGGEPLMIPCHSFLMGNFVQMYRSRSWPAGSLRKESGRLVLDLDAKRYPHELIQFAFYSAYGHVLCIADEQSPTCQELATIRSILTHLIDDTGSLCRHLTDASALVTNMMVILDRLVRHLQPLDPGTPDLLHELLPLFRMSRLFDDLRQKLNSRIRNEVGRHLCATGDSCYGSERQLSCLHCCSSGGGRRKDCLVRELASDTFCQLVLQQANPVSKLESGIQVYLSTLVHLYETNRREAMVKACRDTRCIAGILALIGAPCSTELTRQRDQLAHLCHTLMLLVCDQALICFADTLCYSGCGHDDDHNVESLTPADFQFAVAFTKSVIVAIDYSTASETTVDDSESEHQQQLSAESLRQLRESLCQPGISAMLGYQTSRCRLEKLQAEVATSICSRELRAVAYASYTAGRLPKLRLLVQAVALLLGDVTEVDDEADDAEIDETARVQLCSDGRRILCSEGGLVAALKTFSPERRLSRLMRGQGAGWKFLAELDAASKCKCRESQQQQQTEKSCADHGDIGQACVIFRWVHEAIRSLELLNKTRQSVVEFSPLDGDIKEAAGRFAAAHREFFQRQADELLAAGELESDRHSQLTAALLTAGTAATPAAASGASVAGEVESVEANKKEEDTAFVMKLLPSLHFKFEPLNSHGH